MISEPIQCLHVPNIIFHSSIRKKVFLSQFNMISPNIWNTNYIEITASLEVF